MTIIKVELRMLLHGAKTALSEGLRVGEAGGNGKEYFKTAQQSIDRILDMIEEPKKVPCGCDCKHKLCTEALAAEVLCDFCYYGNAFNDYPHNAKGRKERAALRKPCDKKADDSQEGK